ncbi:MAG: UDP-N-acetylmuramoyl-L-alanine--D-glutamate ligase [bacterium]|nr:UDP-N-acetylmuramoyl-L-alanine--D-glutamate ligase [bacterium]
MSRYRSQKALIFGAGKSGFAAAKLMIHLGGQATILDAKWDEQQRKSYEQAGITCLTARGEDFPNEGVDLVITSPGIPADHPWILAAQQRQLPLLSELEFASTFWQGETWAITGSKGKSSVVKCLTDTLNQNHIPAVAAGNYGTPLSDYCLTLPRAGKGVLAVVEVSSFQLEFTHTFAPRYAAILNLQPDHLDRHKTLENYLAIKSKIFQAQTATQGCIAFLPPTLPTNAIPDGVTIERFGEAPHLDWVYTSDGIQTPTGMVPLAGYFNNHVLGHAAALITALLQHHGLSKEAIAHGFEQFTPLPHRVQTIGEKRGVRFIDDSKGTSLSATQAALKMCGPNLHLIAGGLLKEDDFEFLVDDLRRYAKATYIIGKETQSLVNAWSPILPTHACGTMDEAVRQAFTAAVPGDVILLSPGAASFDQYSGMAARGEHFKACFEAL